MSKQIHSGEYRDFTGACRRWPRISADLNCRRPTGRAVFLSAAAAFILSSGGALAQQPEGTIAGPPASQNGTPGAPVGTTTVPAKAPGFFDTFTATYQIDAGIYGNAANPRNGFNFGQFNEDHANEPELNQVLVTLTRPLATDAKGYDFGFTLQGIYGSDARFLHIEGIDDHLITSRDQIVPTQANLLAHLPWFTTGGIDAKLGIVPGLQGYEALDPGQRQFYSLTYLSYYLLPAEHIGAQATLHVSPTLDIITGIDTGNQTSFGSNDNNSEPAGYIGFALNNLLNNKLTVTTVARLGPEDSRLVFGSRANDLMRVWIDLVATYKYSDALSLSGEAYYYHDDSNGSLAAYSLAGWLAYQINPIVAFNLRGEVLRDDTGVLVGNYLSNTGNIDGIRGLPIQFAGEPSPTTFGSVTANVVIKPAVDWKALDLPIKSVALRPEVRYDRSLNGTATFNDQTTKDAFMFGGDIIVGF